jgi:ABC-type transporter Mla subunit MlaD
MSDRTDEEREFIDMALAAADAGNAGHWPTVAGHLADEVRRLRDLETALEHLAAEWQQSADEDERYLNRAHASEIHDVMASIRINREHAATVLALVPTPYTEQETTK